MKFISVITILSIASLATASPAVLDTRTADAACTAAGGANTCCNSKFGDPNNADAVKNLLAPVFALLGLNLNLIPAATPQVGVMCNAIQVIGVLPAGGKCQAQTVCCMTPETAQAQNQPSGLINILSGDAVTFCPAVAV